MTSSTATVVGAKLKSDGEARLRGTHENGKAEAASTPKDDENYEHFFWTYTEEPHRTRRMAIIKAHPEVQLLRVSVLQAPTNRSPGDEALWS
jgi:hypothetical protein